MSAKLRRLGLHLFLGCVGLALADSRGAAPRNVIFILADDLGYGDLSLHQSPTCQTPTIDSLAAGGIELTRFETASPVCSPSRAGFLTGKFPARLCIRSALGTKADNAAAGSVDWMDPDTFTIAKLMKSNGYYTGHIGKWHLSGQFSDAPSPARYGFDEHAIFNGPTGTSTNRINSKDVFPLEVDFITRNKDRRFFLNVWSHESHTPFKPSDESMAAFAHLPLESRVYAATVRDLDQGLKSIYDALERQGLLDDTLILFSSDNGPEAAGGETTLGNGFGNYYSRGSSAPFKGRKRSLYRGGVTVPFIAFWPSGTLAKHQSNPSVVGAVDLLPTLAAIIGAEPISGIDGENALASLQDQTFNRTNKHYADWTGVKKEPYQWCAWSVRTVAWKLVVDRLDVPARSKLFQISQDPFENVDQQNANPPPPRVSSSSFGPGKTRCRHSVRKAV